MRTRPIHRRCSLLLALPLALNVGNAVADSHEDDVLAGDETMAELLAEDGEEGEAVSSERMKALSEERWDPYALPASLFFGPFFGMMGIDRPPIGINVMGDLLILRPLTAGLGVFSAFTYGIAVGPTMLASPEKHAALRDQLLYSPWRFIRDRPLGEAMPIAESETAEEVDEKSVIEVQ